MFHHEAVLLLDLGELKTKVLALDLCKTLFILKKVDSLKAFHLHHCKLDNLFLELTDFSMLLAIISFDSLILFCR